MSVLNNFSRRDKLIVNRLPAPVLKFNPSPLQTPSPLNGANSPQLISLNGSQYLTS